MDGPTDTTDHDLTENNRALVRSFIETVFVDGQLIRLKDFVDEDSYAEHNPRLGDGVTMLRAALEAGPDTTAADAWVIIVPIVSCRRKLCALRQRGKLWWRSFRLL